MSNGSEKRFVFNFLFLLVGGLYLIRLFYLQVIDETYARYAQINVLHPTVIYPSRGLILDRKGELLVFNDAIYDLMVIPDKIEGMDTADFCKLLKMSRQDFLDRFEDMKKQKGWAPWKSQVFEKQLDVRTYASFQEKLFDFPGFYVEVRTSRNYKINNAAHILGYIGEVTEKDIDESNGYYRAGDFVGISGIEKAYEDRLRGHKGVKYILVDVLNREQGSYKNGTFDSAALAGENLTTTLDLKLQQLGEELMQNKIGSVVAIEPKTGEILAMISSPGYDPNLFIGRERAKNYLKLLRDPLKPLFNRPIAAPYPPGSIFKIIMALVGQQEGVLTPETQYSCARGYNNGSNFVGCHRMVHPLICAALCKLVAMRISVTCLRRLLTISAMFMWIRLLKNGANTS
jgi:penicillin-binding protein 2